MRKKTIIFKLSVILVLALAGSARGQEIDRRQPQSNKTFPVGKRLEIPKDAAGRKRFERDHYRRTLGIDSVKAEQVLKVQTEYKAAMGGVVADTSLNDLGKRAAIDRLIGLKNAQLERLLTPLQQSKVIPTTERTPRAVRGQ